MHVVAAIDLVNDAPKGKRRKTRGVTMTDQEVAASVSKKIYDNLRDLVPQEIDGNTDVAGKTLRECLTERLRLHIEDPAVYPVGKTSYAQCRDTFRSAESPQKRVLVAAQALKEDIHVDLVDKMVKYRTTGARHGVIGYVQMCDRLGAQEFLGVCNMALDIRPASSTVDSLKQAVQLCEAFARLRVKDTHAKYFPLIKDWLDQVMVQVLASSKGATKRPTVYCSTHKDVLEMLLPSVALQAVLGHQAAWAEQAGNLMELCNSSMVGLKLFGGACMSVMGETVTDTIQQVVTSLFNNHRITADILATSQRAANTAVRALPNFKLFADKRAIKLNYRGRSFTYSCKSIADEIEHTFMVEVKTRAVNCGDLIDVSCERQLADGGHQGVQGQIDLHILNKCTAARNQVNSGLKCNADSRGSTVVQWLHKNRKNLELVDGIFSVEIAFFEGMLGADGEAALQRMAKAALPTQATAVDFAVAKASLGAVQVSGLFNFCDEGVQNQVRLVASMIEDLFEGRSPQFQNRASNFLVDVKMQLQYFCRLMQGQAELVGEAAARAMVAAARALPEEDLHLEHLAGPTRFAWLLQQADRTVVEGLRTMVLTRDVAKEFAGAAGTVVAASSSSSSSAAAPKAKAKKIKAASELEAAYAMFGKR